MSNNKWVSFSMLHYSLSDSPIVLVQADSITRRNAHNCCFRYHVKIDDIMTLAFWNHDIHSDYNKVIANSFFIELLVCRNGALRLFGSDFDYYDLQMLISLVRIEYLLIV